MDLKQMIIIYFLGFLGGTIAGVVVEGLCMSAADAEDLEEQDDDSKRS